MPILELKTGARINYIEKGPTQGANTAVLLIAPGGMRSAIEFWERTPWNPLEQLSSSHRVIAMDQRNAGSSTGPVSEADGWHTYLADQLGLLDALGVQRFHVIGMCIGGPYALGLAQAAPERVASAVLMQSIGREDNTEIFYDMFDSWAAELKSIHPLSDAQWQSFRANMFGGDRRLFNVDDAFIRSSETPLLVFQGDDAYHPKTTSQHIRALGRRVSYVERWKDPDSVTAGSSALAAFLAEHSG